MHKLTRSLELLIDHLGRLAGQAGLNGEESTLKNGSACVSGGRIVFAKCKRFKIAIERTPLRPFYVLEFTCALFHEFREALNGKFKEAEIFWTDPVPIGCVNILEVMLQHKANIPLCKAICHLEKHGPKGIIDIWALGASGGSLVFWVIVIWKDGRLGTRRTIPLASTA